MRLGSVYTLIRVQPTITPQEQQMTIAILIDTPFLSIPEYAKRTGLSVRTVTEDMETGLIPFYQRMRKSKRLVNMVALAQMAATAAESPEPWNHPQQIGEIS